MRHAILYRGTWLARGSRAFELHEAGQLQALDRHIKEVFEAARRRGESA